VSLNPLQRFDRMAMPNRHDIALKSLNHFDLACQ
jgi:hypothetical protein